MFNAEEESFLSVPDIEPVKSFLLNAINKRIPTDGEKIQYELIVNQLKVRDDPETLWKVLVSLCSFTYQLTKHSDRFRALLNCIFNYDWKCDMKVSMAIVNLINQIVYTNATFLGRAFQLFVKSLLPNMTTTLLTETVEEGLLERRQLIHRAIRNIILHVPTGRSVLYPILVEYFPHKRFSRNVQTEYVTQLLYICSYEPMLQANILELIFTKCLEMDVEIVIEDTGEVRIDEEAAATSNTTLEDDLSFEEDFQEEDMFQLAGNNSNSSIKSASHKFQQQYHHHHNNYPTRLLKQPLLVKKQLTDNTVKRIPAEVAEMADKLDAILVLVVNFCEKEINLLSLSSSSQALLLAGSENNNNMNNNLNTQATTVLDRNHNNNNTATAVATARRERLLQHLLAVFESAVLPIHKSKFVQFVIFYAASLHSQFAKSVSDKLLSITLDSRCSSTQRQSAVMYLSSYLSRASFLSFEYISDIVSRLIIWASQYVTSTGGSAVTTISTINNKSDTAAVVFSDNNHYHSLVRDVEFDEFGRAFVREQTASRHELFYSAVQSACYTLCFHGVDMVIQQRENSSIRAHWETIVSSRYDPLKFCLKSVRVEFIKLAAAVGLFHDHCWDSLSSDLLYSDVVSQHNHSSHNSNNNDKIISATTVSSGTLTTHAMENSNGTTTVTATSNIPRSQSLNKIQSYNNNNSQGIVSSSSTGTNNITDTGTSNGLDSFFPFDPCLLCQLHQTIEKNYRSWEGVPGLEELLNQRYRECEEDDEEEEDYEDFDEEEDDEESSASSNSHALGSGNSSITSNSKRSKNNSNNNKQQHSMSLSKALAIPSRHHHRRHSRNSMHDGNMAAYSSHTSGSAMDMFSTSSLSSMVSSLACTDTGTAASMSMMSVVSSYNNQRVGNINNSTGIGMNNNNDEEDDEDEEQCHMHISSSVLNNHQRQHQQQQQLFMSHNNNSNLTAAVMYAGAAAATANSNANNVVMEEFVRRPRFYSIGSTGSW